MPPPSPPPPAPEPASAAISSSVACGRRDRSSARPRETAGAARARLERADEELLELLSRFVGVADVLEHVVGVFARELADDLGTARVVLEVLGDVVDLGAAVALVPDDDVAVLLLVVRRDLRQGAWRAGAYAVRLQGAARAGFAAPAARVSVEAAHACAAVDAGGAPLRW